MKFLLVFLFLFNAHARDQFVFPLAQNTVIENYAKKISTKRNKYQTLRKIDRFRSESKTIKKMLEEKPHEKVIESIYAVDAPLISTVAITKDEVTPFYSNFFF